MPCEFLTKDDVLSLLETKPWAVIRGVEALYARQTADEQSSETTAHHNGRGFNGTDARLLSSFAKQIHQWRQTDVESRRYAFPLSPKQFRIAAYRLKKYAGQLATIANENLEREAREEARRERDAIMSCERDADLEEMLQGIES